MSNAGKYEEKEAKKELLNINDLFACAQWEGKSFIFIYYFNVIRHNRRIRKLQIFDFTVEVR